MTPVAGLAGLPIVAAPAAVDIQPHGLDLGEPATLTITPAAAIPVADQFTFGAREGGLDVHGFPPTASTSAIELPLTHFSIYGAAAATDAEVVEVTGRVAVDAQAQFEAEISGLLQEARRTGEEYDTTEIAAIMRRLFDTVVRPRLIAAESDDTLAVLAVGTFFGWDRQRQLLGDDGVARRPLHRRAQPRRDDHRVRLGPGRRTLPRRRPGRRWEPDAARAPGRPARRRP